MNKPIEIFEGHTISIILEKFRRDAYGVEIPLDFDVSCSYSFVIYSDAAKNRPALIFQETGPCGTITKEGNKIEIYLESYFNPLRPKKYYCSLEADLSSEDTYLEAPTEILVSPGRKTKYNNMACDEIIKARTGIVKKVIENVFWYTSLGTEGKTLTFDGVAIPLNLRGRVVTAVNRENYELKPTGDVPTPKEFNWNSTTNIMTFAADFAPSEQLKITFV